MPDCRFWIVTPSYKSLHWLPCAVASVADQVGNGIAVHHHVQDGGSDDGTREWLEAYARQCADSPRAGYTFSFESAPDAGMYDAINKGWSRAPQGTDFLGHLNSDEQYLPGALQAVAQTAQAQPAADLVLGDALVVDAQGHYICHQSSVKPWAWMSRYFCIVLTCTAFYRPGLLAESGVRFDPSWRILGDVIFYRHLFRHRVRVKLCNQPTSVFVDSGENMATGPGTPEELARYAREYKRRFAGLARWVRRVNTLRRLWKDMRRGLSRSFRLYLPNAIFQRSTFEIARPTSLWRRRMT